MSESSNIALLNKTVKLNDSLVDDLMALSEKYPDLQIYRPDQTKAEYFIYTNDVNGYVDNIDILEERSSRIEGGDMYLYIWPYVKVDNIKVYSDPPYYNIATANTKGFGFIPAEGWEAMLDEDKISNSVVRKIRFHLSSKTPVFYY